MAKSLKLDGRPISFAKKTPAVDRLVNFLEKLPEDELLTSHEITDRGLCGKDTLMRAARSTVSPLTPHRYLLPTGYHAYVFGCAKAIIAVRELAKKELGKA